MFGPTPQTKILSPPTTYPHKHIYWSGSCVGALHNQSEPIIVTNNPPAKTKETKKEENSQCHRSHGFYTDLNQLDCWIEIK